MSDDLSGFSLMDLFRSEADSNLAILSEGLIALEGSATTAQAIEPLMRAAHSLKGAARIVGLDPAVRIAHALEDAFVAAQGGLFVIGATQVDVMLRGVDLLGKVAQLEEGQSSAWEQANEAAIVAVVGDLARLKSPGEAPEPAAVTDEPTAAGTEPEPVPVVPLVIEAGEGFEQLTSS